MIVRGADAVCAVCIETTGLTSSIAESRPRPKEESPTSMTTTTSPQSCMEFAAMFLIFSFSSDIFMSISIQAFLLVVHCLLFTIFYGNN